MSMTCKEAIEYLRPVADSHPVAGYAKALDTAIRALEEVDSLRAELAEERERFDRYADYSVERDKMIEQLKEDLRQSYRHDTCEYCVHQSEPVYCEEDGEWHMDGTTCEDCEECSKWEWRGMVAVAENATTTGEQEGQ